MNNISAKEFCRRFDACRAGTRFALRYETMRECYAALLAGEAGVHSAELAIWTITRPDVMSDRNLRLFAVKCARRVQHLMKDSRSIAALDVAERYAQGEATDEELNVASAAASAAARAAWAAWAAARAAWAAARAAWAAADAAARDDIGAVTRDAAAAAASAAASDAARDDERKAQLALLAEFGNPFGVDHD